MEFIAQNIPALICVLAGVGLLVVEAFMPGFGVAGISGILFEAIAVVLVYQTSGAMAAAITLLVALTVIAIALSVSLRSAAKGKISQSEMILRGTERPEDGYVANEDMKVFLGRTGTVITTLRPTGMAEFDGVRLNVMSSGEFIEAGTQVLIEKVDGSRILVRALTAKA